MDLLKKIHDEHLSRKAKITQQKERGDNLTFHDKELARAKTDGSHDQPYLDAINLGRRTFNDALDAIKNPDHPDHIRQTKSLNETYGGDLDAMQSGLIDKTVKALKVHRLEIKNPSYESNILKPYIIRTQLDSINLAKLKDYLKSKWALSGYSGDADLINDFWACHKYSSDVPQNNFAKK
ncbi:MAG: hypothetical protein EKK37_00830 [Sphingobacteriales bacterium]|nr:MAG: hypothetical protein EKK37_00830 [Sphingobacteriales bacterium]